MGLGSVLGRLMLVLRCLGLHGLLEVLRLLRCLVLLARLGCLHLSLHVLLLLHTELLSFGLRVVSRLLGVELIGSHLLRLLLNRLRLLYLLNDNLVILVAVLVPDFLLIVSAPPVTINYILVLVLAWR